MERYSPRPFVNEDIGSIMSEVPSPSAHDRKVEMLINVNTAKGKKTIVVHEGDDPDYLSADFCVKYEVKDPAKQRKLYEIVRQKVYDHRN